MDEPNGFVVYLGEDDEGKTKKTVYYHNLMGQYWVTEDHKDSKGEYIFTQNPVLYNLVEMERSPELEGIVFLH